jgi:methyltransferase (TIGR00027 family)
MSERDPRKMALQIAGLRANETHLPENERVFEDPYAEWFFPADVRKTLQNPDLVKAERAKYESVMPGVNGAIVARIRYIDECLAGLIEEGLRQLVIIGAGYDTRAYRIPGVRGALRVLEVDHPLTQATKRETIRQIFGELPEHVIYVPLVFGRDRLAEELQGHGYDPGLRTLFIIEGLLMYIPEPAVEALMVFVAGTSVPGSTFVADYFDCSVIEGTSPLPEARALKMFVEQEGAALLFGFENGRAEARFRKCGFSAAKTVNAADCKAAYFPATGQERQVSSMFNFVTATV